MKPISHKLQSMLFLFIVFYIGIFLSGCNNGPSKELINKVKSIHKVIVDYEYGDSRSWLQEYQDLMIEVYNIPEIHDKVERLMIKVLKSNASNDGKLLICKYLGTIGGNSSLPVLRKMLFTPSSSNMALIALTSIPGEEASKTLIGALENNEGEALIGIINTLGLRRDPKANQPLNGFISSEDQHVANASIHALGTIGGEQASQILQEAFVSTTNTRKWKIAEAWIKSVESLEPAQRKLSYQTVLDSNPPLSLKYVAFKENLKLVPEDKQVSHLLDAINNSNQEFQEAVIPLIRNLPSTLSMKPFINEFSIYPDRIQIQLMLAIADRKDESIRPFVIQKLKSNNPDDRNAALKSLSKVSNYQDVRMITKVAVSKTGIEQELARACLYWMKGENVDRKILSELEFANAQVKPELIKCVGYRKIEDGRKVLMGYLSSKNKLIRVEAIKAVGIVASHEDLAKVIDLTLSNIKTTELEMIEHSITSIAFNDPDSSVPIIGEKLTSYQNALSISILINVAGKLGGDQALTIIRPYLNNDQEEIQFSCIKALSAWRDDTPLPDLEALIQSTLSQKNRSQAMVGIVYLVQNSKSLTEALKAMKLKNAYSFAKSDLDRKIIVNGISRVVSLDALDFVIDQLGNDAIEAEVEEAIIRIAGNLRESHTAEVEARMTSVLEKSDHQEFKGKVNVLLRSMQL